MSAPIPSAEALLAAIRAHCLECSGGSRKEVRNCRVTGCSLYPYRAPDAQARQPEKPQRHRQISIADLINTKAG